MKVKIRSPFPQLDISRTARIFRHFGHHLKPHKRGMGIGAVALIAMTLVELALPWPLKIVFDYILLPDQATDDIGFLQRLASWDPMTVLWLVAGLVVGFALLRAVLSEIQTLSFASVGLKVAGAIRLELFSHVQRLPQSYHDYRQTGELMMRLTTDINMLKELLISILMTLGSRILVILGMLAVMFYLDWQLTLIALSVLPLLFITSVRFTVRMRSASRRQRKKIGQISAMVYDGVDSIVLSKMFGQEKRHQSNLGRLIRSDARAGLRIKRLEAEYERWVDVITAVGMMLVLFFGVRDVLAGTLSTGSLLIFILYLRSAYRPLRQIARIVSRITKATVSGERVLEILDIEPDIVDKPDAVSARHIKGDIRFDNVTFAYKAKSEQAVLNGITFDIPAGRTTAIVGASGAGKSTVAKLLIRLYQPDEGRISIDGLALDEYRFISLRDRITILSQETLLFRETILDNISFGKPEAEIEEVIAAARKVGADDFIQALPDGYNTLIGESGQTLSGGQRQRIAFARAALRDSKIMIFDEPATGLDPGAEKVVQEAVIALKKNRTILLITHRLNLLDLADKIVFLESGASVEQGNTEELLARRGRFFDFYQEWMAQTGIPRLSGAAIN